MLCWGNLSYDFRINLKLCILWYGANCGVNIKTRWCHGADQYLSMKLLVSSIKWDPNVCDQDDMCQRYFAASKMWHWCFGYVVTYEICLWFTVVLVLLPAWSNSALSRGLCLTLCPFHAVSHSHVFAIRCHLIVTPVRVPGNWPEHHHEVIIPEMSVPAMYTLNADFVWDTVRMSTGIIIN